MGIVRLKKRKESADAMFEVEAFMGTIYFGGQPL